MDRCSDDDDDDKNLTALLNKLNGIEECFTATKSFNDTHTESASPDVEIIDSHDFDQNNIETPPRPKDSNLDASSIQFIPMPSNKEPDSIQFDSDDMQLCADNDVQECKTDSDVIVEKYCGNVGEKKQESSDSDIIEAIEIDRKNVIDLTENVSDDENINLRDGTEEILEEISKIRAVLTKKKKKKKRKKKELSRRRSRTRSRSFHTKSTNSDSDENKVNRRMCSYECSSHESQSRSSRTDSHRWNDYYTSLKYAVGERVRERSSVERPRKKRRSRSRHRKRRKKRSSSSSGSRQNRRQEMSPLHSIRSKSHEDNRKAVQSLRDVHHLHQSMMSFNFDSRPLGKLYRSLIFNEPSETLLNGSSLVRRDEIVSERRVSAHKTTYQEIQSFDPSGSSSSMQHTSQINLYQVNNYYRTEYPSPWYPYM